LCSILRVCAWEKSPLIDIVNMCSWAGAEISPTLSGRLPDKPAKLREIEVST
jgi:hypothetical protein